MRNARGEPPVRGSDKVCPEVHNSVELITPGLDGQSNVGLQRSDHYVCTSDLMNLCVVLLVVDATALRVLPPIQQRTVSTRQSRR